MTGLMPTTVEATEGAPDIKACFSPVFIDIIKNEDRPLFLQLGHSSAGEEISGTQVNMLLDVFESNIEGIFELDMLTPTSTGDSHPASQGDKGTLGVRQLRLSQPP